VSTPDEYLANDEFERVTGWRFRDPGCAALVVGETSEMTCTYAMENSWSQALDVGPFGGSSFEFVVADGQIQKIIYDFDTSEFSSQVWRYSKHG